MHIPVMPDQVLEFLNLKPGMVVLDATGGSGGHSELMYEGIMPKGRLIILDRDLNAVERLQARFTGKKEVVVIHSNYSDIDHACQSVGVEALDGVLMDLGVSTEQIDSRERGFSFRYDSEIDMRMDQSKGPTAGELLASLPEEDLANILYEYGEERKSRIIAKHIVERRHSKPLTSTEELAELISNCLGGRRGKIHPATRTFQALRIAVNEELQSLEEALGKVVAVMRPEGRIAAITYHSLEDRIVKRKFRKEKDLGNLHLLSKKVVRPKWTEIQGNPRSRSAKLRAAEKKCL